MSNKYSKLCIDKNKITEWIELWCEENLEGMYEIEKEDKKQRIQYTINNEDNIIKIHFIKCSNGLLTITPNVGSNIEKSKQIADSIYSRISDNYKKSPFSNGFSIVLSDDIFDIIIELISTMDGVTLNNYSEHLNEGQAKYKLYKFTGKAGDTVTIKWHISTKRMQMQGKPLWLFNEIVSLVSENGAQMNDVVDAQIEYCNIDIEKNDILEEMKEILGEELYNYLSDTQKAILSTTFIMSKVNIEMIDYSGLIYPVLRTYEGFTKKVYGEYNLNCVENKTIGMMFFDTNHKMKKKYACTIEEDIVEKLTQMYDFLNKNRHPYFHSSAIDADTKIITERKIADEIINEVIKIMKSFYKSLIQEK